MKCLDNCIKNLNNVLLLLKNKYFYISIFFIYSAFWIYSAYEVDTSYLYTAVSYILNGELMYRDFAYAQYPFSAYFYVPFFYLFGNTIFIGRTVNIFLMTLTYILSSKIVKNFTKHNNEKPYFYTLLFYVVNISYLGKMAWVGSKEALACFLLCLSIYIVLKTSKTYLLCIILGFIFSIFLLTKLTYLPLIIILLCWEYFLYKNKKKTIIILTVFLSLTILVLGIFYKNAPEQFIALTSSELINCKTAGFNRTDFIYLFDKFPFHLDYFKVAFKYYFKEYVVFYLFILITTIIIYKKKNYIKFNNIFFLWSILIYILIYGFFFTVRSHPHYLAMTIPIIGLLSVSFFIYVNVQYHKFYSKKIIKLIIFFILSIFLHYQYFYFSSLYSGVPFYRNYGHRWLLNYIRFSNYANRIIPLYYPENAKGISLRYNQFINRNNKIDLIRKGYIYTTNFIYIEDNERAKFLNLVNSKMLYEDISLRKADFIAITSGEYNYINKKFKIDILDYGYKIVYRRYGYFIFIKINNGEL